MVDGDKECSLMAVNLWAAAAAMAERAVGVHEAFLGEKTPPMSSARSPMNDVERLRRLTRPPRLRTSALRLAIRLTDNDCL